MICQWCGVTLRESPFMISTLGIIRAYTHPGNLFEVCPGPSLNSRPPVWKIFAAYDHYVDMTNCAERPEICTCIDDFAGWLSWQDVL